MEQVGRYKIESELGHGAMGVVYRAFDPAIGRTVAIKTIRLAEVEDADERARLRDRLLHEARSAGVLSHPGIVTVYDVSEEDDLAYIAMEFVNGPTLEKLLSSEQPPDAKAIFRVLREMAAALDYAHKKGIVHRDIKPANIMIHDDGTVKITDFGVAKMPAPHLATQAGMVLGTPSYLSPEQALGRPVDGRSDQFSLAVLAFEMLTGEKPFAAEQLAALVYKIAHEETPSAMQLNPSLGWQVDVVLRRALDKGPAARFPSCAEFIKALETACNTSKGWKPLPRGGGQSLPTVEAEVPKEQVPAPPLVQPEPTRVEHGRKRVNLSVVLLVTSAIAVLALAGVWFATRRPPNFPVEPSANVQTQQGAASRPSPAGAAIPKTEAAEQSASAPSETEAPAEPKPDTAPAVVAPLSESRIAADVTVQVRTSPPGADVVFDGNQARTCQTPCSVTLPPGRHTAAATFAGYRPALRIFQLPSESDLFLYMTKMTGEVQIITDPAGASILVDGQPRTEVTPATLALPVGKCTVAVAKPGYMRDEQQIEVKDGAFVRLNFILGK